MAASPAGIADTPDPLRVLVVDDEPSIVDVLCTGLRHHGYRVESAVSGADALGKARDWRPHAIVLDVMLPDMDGFDVARRLTRQRSDIPILFLSARDNTADKVRGLELGGDDYVTKPFSIEELVARLRVIMRRSGTVAATPEPLRFADLQLDEDLREVTRGDEPIELTVTEYRLLRYLLVNARRVMTRAQLLDHVWGYDFGGDARVLETYVSYLRRKLDAHGPPLVHTVRGVGYVLRMPRGTANAK
jgi:two-component system, OmpR family, response regulator